MVFYKILKFLYTNFIHLKGGKYVEIIVLYVGVTIKLSKQFKTRI